MALAIHFQTTATRAEYDEIWRRLDAAGQHDPRGRQYHVSWGDEGALEVLDVWDSQADFDAFANTLMPILGAVGVQATPRVMQAYKIVQP
jgi:hypothetical protein